MFCPGGRICLASFFLRIDLWPPSAGLLLRLWSVALDSTSSNLDCLDVNDAFFFFISIRWIAVLLLIKGASHQLNTSFHKVSKSPFRIDLSIDTILHELKKCIRDNSTNNLEYVTTFIRTGLHQYTLL